MPPTDPRILSMTPEQIDLEFSHIIIDKKLRDKAEGKNTYNDTDFEDYDKDSEETDSQLSDIPTMRSIDPYNVETVKFQEKEGDWVDVETDDY